MYSQLKMIKPSTIGRIALYSVMITAGIYFAGQAREYLQREEINRLTQEHTYLLQKKSESLEKEKSLLEKMLQGEKSLLQQQEELLKSLKKIRDKHEAKGISI